MKKKLVACDIVIAVISFLAGVLVTYCFYYQSGKDLKVETEELKRLNNLMLRAMENTGQVKLHRDASDKITGFVIELSGTVKGEASGAAELSTK
jgi:hypothetical protein